MSTLNDIIVRDYLYVTDQHNIISDDSLYTSEDGLFYMQKPLPYRFDKLIPTYGYEYISFFIAHNNGDILNEDNLSTRLSISRKQLVIDVSDEPSLEYYNYHVSCQESLISLFEYSNDNAVLRSAPLITSEFTDIIKFDRGYLIFNLPYEKEGPISIYQVDTNMNNWKILTKGTCHDIIKPYSIAKTKNIITFIGRQTIYQLYYGNKHPEFVSINGYDFVKPLTIKSFIEFSNINEDETRYIILADEDGKSKILPCNEEFEVIESYDAICNMDMLYRYGDDKIAYLKSEDRKLYVIDSVSELWSPPVNKIMSENETLKNENIKLNVKIHELERKVYELESEIENLKSGDKIPKLKVIIHNLSSENANLMEELGKYKTIVKRIKDNMN